MSKRITKAVLAAFDEQIATMKRNEEAAGLWCICGHSSPTHDNGFTCQSVACDCLSFRPSNADTWCQCNHAKYNHGEDDFSSQECNVGGCDCKNFTCTAEPSAPRAGERDTQSQLFPRYSFAIVTGRYKILDNRSEGPTRITQIATADGEDEARTIVHALNAAEQHATLIEQRQWLIETLRDEITALETWKKARGLPIDVADGIAISLSKLAATLATIEQEGEA